MDGVIWGSSENVRNFLRQIRLQPLQSTPGVQGIGVAEHYSEVVI
jgi:hypothetical protein